MSLEIASSELVRYVHCNFCNTMLAVSIPCGSMLTIVTVRCGHCANLLPVQTLPFQDLQKQQPSNKCPSKDSGTSSKCNKFGAFASPDQNDPPRSMPPVPPPEKKARVPSAYNRFIKEEIQRIKASNPDISHREAFSAAAKNWAHFPHTHFGLKLDGSKQAKLDQPKSWRSSADHSEV